MRIQIYTDGACSGNPGPGGWGVLMRWNGHEKELSGGEPETTNNRMEMTAVIKGLEALKKESRVALYTDSKYVKQGVEEWLAGWKARGWKTAAKKPVRIRTFGSRSIRFWPCMRSSFTGSKAIPAMLKTRLWISWQSQRFQKA